MDSSKKAYFAGLLEGDGCLSLHKAGNKVYPTIRLCLTDIDPVAEFCQYVNAFLGVKGFEKALKVRHRKQRNISWKDTFTISFEGRRAEFLMRDFFPYWFSHRKNQVIRIFEECELRLPSYSTVSLNDAWLAGLADAEGCFRRVVKGKTYPHFRINMTDEDIINFLVSRLNAVVPPMKRISGKGGQEKFLETRKYVDKRSNRKPTYYCTIGGRRALELTGRLKRYMLNASKVKEIEAFEA